MLGWRLSILAHNWANMTSKRQWGRDSLLKRTSSIRSNIQPHSGNKGDFLCVCVFKPNRRSDGPDTCKGLCQK